MKFADFENEIISQYFDKDIVYLHHYNDGDYQDIYTRKRNDGKLIVLVIDNLEFEIDYISHRKNNYIFTIRTNIQTNTKFTYRIDEEFTIRIYNIELIYTF